MQKILLAISSCLLGKKVRYDGKHKKNAYITDTLSKYFEWLAICPEVEYGLPVPREPMRLVSIDNKVRLITIKSLVDHTDGLSNWSENKIKELATLGISGCIFKSKSPSSAISDAEIYNEKGAMIKKGPGVFGGIFIERFPHLPVIDDVQIDSHKLRTVFFNKVFCYKRWQDFTKNDGSIFGLINFHTKHKLIIMSHSVRHYFFLGKLIANLTKINKDILFEIYIKHFMDALSFQATVKKNINVLMHCIGYFKKLLSHDEKEEFKELLEGYRNGEHSLDIPITLINHYSRKYDICYLKDQYYLKPLPLELTI